MYLSLHVSFLFAIYLLFSLSPSPFRPIFAAYAQENGCIFFETSAKTGENINDVFRAIAEKLPKHQPAAAAAANNVSITDDFSNDNSKKGCC